MHQPTMEQRQKKPPLSEGSQREHSLTDSLADMLRRTLRESVRSRDAVTKVIAATRVSTRSYDKKVRDSCINSLDQACPAENSEY